MKVVRYSYAFTPDEEVKRLEATTDHVAAQFKKDFDTLMAKYKATISVRENTSGYTSYVEGIDVDFDGIHDFGVTFRPFFTVQFDSNME